MNNLLSIFSVAIVVLFACIAEAIPFRPIQSIHFGLTLPVADGCGFIVIATHAEYVAGSMCSNAIRANGPFMEHAAGEFSPRVQPLWAMLDGLRLKVGPSAFRPVTGLGQCRAPGPFCEMFHLLPTVHT